MNLQYLWNLIRIKIKLYITGYKQMKIFIKRLEGTDHGIFGHLTMDGSGFNCVTLERHDIYIPEGTYKVTLYKSPKHKGELVPLLHDVPRRSFIEIHPGNWETDSEGCILVGADRSGWALEHSKVAFNDLMQQLQGCDDITITIS